MRERGARDVSSPEAVERIWAEAREQVRKERKRPAQSQHLARLEAENRRLREAIREALKLANNPDTAGEYAGNATVVDADTLRLVLGGAA